MSLLIKNAQLVGQDNLVDIYIKDGRIERIASVGTGSAFAPVRTTADKHLSLQTRQIDAQGKLVLPGAIDPHVHFRVPGAEHKEDWQTGYRAALKGGVTTVLDMPNNQPSITTLEALQKKYELIQSQVQINFGLYLGATKENLEEIKSSSSCRTKDERLVCKIGASLSSAEPRYSEITPCAVKVFLGSSTGNLLVDDYDIFEKILRASKVLVAVHAEDEALIQDNVKLQNLKIYAQGAFASGEKSSSKSKCLPAELVRQAGQITPLIHSKIRSEECAVKAVKEVIKRVRRTHKPVYICHVSSKGEVELIRQAKAAGLPIYMEVAPHHLFLNTEAYAQLKNFAKMNPPLRSPESQDALWSAISDGIVDTIGSDHAPHTKKEKEQDYCSAPSGVPGVETTLPLLLDAVNHGKLSLQRLVQLTSQNPAKIFGLKNKGQIAEGYDADLVIVDMDKEQELKNENLAAKCKWSPFAGMRLKGWPIVTIVGGEVKWRDKTS